ncbi:MAG: ABC transporter ATP-binding protein [Rhodospirillales bacterium]
MRLAARGIVVRLGGAVVLDHVDFEVGDGTVVGLIGPNGAGKSTLLRVLAHLQPTAAGAVNLDGRPLGGYDAGERARRIAYLAQGTEVHWPLSVAAVVGLGRLPHRAGARGETAADRAAVARAMAATDVAGLRERSIGALSGGERARALIARALAVEAPLLLADEPTAGLDPYHQLQVMELLRATAGDGRAVVVVLHDLTLAARFCDRILLLDRGAAVADGVPAAVLTAQNLARAYRVEAVHGTRDGAPYVVPWRRCGDGPHAAG